VITAVACDIIGWGPGNARRLGRPALKVICKDKIMPVQTTKGYRAFHNVRQDYKKKKKYYRKTVGHVFTKLVQVEGTTQNFFFSFPTKMFLIVVHNSVVRRCECM
jgi:hypothetical protein